MIQTDGKRFYWTFVYERAVISLFAFIYLISFNRTVSHGDALRVVRQIQDNHLTWNPNHLLFDPIGYGWYALLQNIGLNITALNSFELISGIASIVSLLIFHAILVQAGIKSWCVRAVIIGGLFASKSFLALATNQYYFMIQMPFLLGALYLIVQYLDAKQDDQRRAKNLYGIGVLTAIAGTMLFSNVMLVVALGLVAGFVRNNKKTVLLNWNYVSAARLWGAAALVGFPTYIAGYALSGSGAGFFAWLLSYQGESGSALNDLYFVQPSLHRVIESLARLGFNFFSASILENAGLGTYFRALFFREPLEFVPDIFRLSLVFVLTPAIIGMMSLLLVRVVRRFRQDALIPVAFAWIISYLLFNFLWSVGGEHFWVQTTPIVWLLWAGYLVSSNTRSPVSEKFSWGTKNWKLWSTAIAVPALLVVNTLNAILPVSATQDAERNAYHALLRNGDLEIMPGWEVIGWLRSEAGRPDAERLLLKNMALQPEGHEHNILRLPDIVQKHLATGRRVVVGRLYDKDHEVNPWYGLARLGWSRNRLQSLLGGYCNTVIAKVDDVVFREITACLKNG